MRYVRRGEIELEELMQAGTFGLYRTIEKFDLSRGHRFSTYAHRWIQAFVQRYINNHATTIRLPSHMRDRLASIHRVTGRFVAEHGREPDNNELLDLARMDRSKLDGASRAAQVVATSSVDAPIGGEAGGDSFLSFLPAHTNVVRDVEAGELGAALDRALLRYLPPRQERIIRMRFGMDGNAPMTLAEVAARYGLTRERIRQLEHEALATLREAAELAAWHNPDSACYMEPPGPTPTHLTNEERASHVGRRREYIAAAVAAEQRAVSTTEVAKRARIAYVTAFKDLQALARAGRLRSEKRKGRHHWRAA